MYCATIAPAGTNIGNSGPGAAVLTVPVLTVDATPVSTCPDTSLVVLTHAELRATYASPWNLSLSEGGQIAAAILVVWAAAYAIRAVISVLNSGEPER